jgi:hypothetical protein
VGVNQFGVGEIYGNPSTTWLTFAHELGHNFGAHHSFEQGQGNTGGIMDYGNDKQINGAYQFNSLRRSEICGTINGIPALSQGCTQEPRKFYTAGTTASKPPQKGSSCVDVTDTTVFNQGDLIRIGAPNDCEHHRIVSISTSSCPSSRRLSSSRRLTSVGSLNLDGQLANSWGNNVAISTVNSVDEGGGTGGTPGATPPPTPPGGAAPAAPACFPGDAIVNVRGRGAIPVATLAVGDNVLVESAGGKLTFAPVLTFLHKVGPNSATCLHKSVTVLHTHGTFQASWNHLVFVISENGVREDVTASALRPGDQLLIQSNATALIPSPIISIRSETTCGGMYAPLTSSGAIFVDGVLASNYGAPSSKVHLPHGAAHATFFALRMYYYLIPDSISKRFGYHMDGDEFHPFVKILLKEMALDRFLISA